MIIYTIGHSTHPLEEFIDLLSGNGVTRLIDVRTVPGSRYNPQFMQESMQVTLPAHGIEYSYMKALGGLRRTADNSINTGWRNKSFRGYADYMQTSQFKTALDELIMVASKHTAAIMCAEAVPLRCHRSLIADALTVRGIEVKEIITNKPPKTHILTGFAKVNGTDVTYPPVK